MQAELKIDTQELIKEIAKEVIRAIRPLLVRNTSEDTILDITGLADYLKVTPRWVYDQIHLKQIPYFKVGRFPRFRKSEIDRWIESHRAPQNDLSKYLKVVK